VTDAHATVDLIGDIKVGDKVWVCSDMYRSKSEWSLQTVTKIARVYFRTTNDTEWPDDWEFARDGGFGRTVRGFSPGRRAFGQLDRFLHENRYRINRTVENTRDPATLLKIARVLGIPTPKLNGETP
jgi:hypothetical protein